MQHTVTGWRIAVICLAVLAGAWALGAAMEGAFTAGLQAQGTPGTPASYESHGKTIAIEVFRPTGDAKLPAVLMLHGADCLQVPWITAGYRASARKLAKRGYVVLLVHYMDRTGTKSTNPIDMARNFMPWMETIRDGITYAQGRQDVQKDQIGLVGVSLGASLSICVGGVDDRVKAVVEYFGALPEAAVPQVKRTPPILILHGDADWIVNVREAHKLEMVLKEKGLPYEMHIYPGQGHGFTGEAAKDSDERTVSFLDKYLKPRKQPTETGAASRHRTASQEPSGPDSASRR